MKRLNKTDINKILNDLILNLKQRNMNMNRASNICNALIPDITSRLEAQFDKDVFQININSGSIYEIHSTYLKDLRKNNILLDDIMSTHLEFEIDYNIEYGKATVYCDLSHDIKDKIIKIPIKNKSFKTLNLA